MIDKMINIEYKTFKKTIHIKANIKKSDIKNIELSELIYQLSLIDICLIGEHSFGNFDNIFTFSVNGREYQISILGNELIGLATNKTLILKKEELELIDYE